MSLYTRGKRLDDGSKAYIITHVDDDGNEAEFLCTPKGQKFEYGTTVASLKEIKGLILDGTLTKGEDSEIPEIAKDAYPPNGIWDCVNPNALLVLLALFALPDIDNIPDELKAAMLKTLDAHGWLCHDPKDGVWFVGRATHGSLDVIQACREYDRLNDGTLTKSIISNLRERE